MAAQRPRLSVLSLFDPFSSSSDSIDSDKENDCGNSSFFHFSKQVYSPVRRLRRRLIDVGDVTVEEPDIRDLIEKELEAEINHSVILEEDENATLTFRDMAKAATPKWSGKHAGRKGTPNTLSTPRTPLAEIVTRDEITPVGRKKIFKRPPAGSVPQASPLNVVHTAQDIPTLVVHDLDNASGNPPFAIFVPRTEIRSGDNETIKTSTSPSSMGTSTATLELPTPSDALISDTPIPLFISSSSSNPNHASRAPSPLTESRLRPNAHVSESSNRHSVDLHASFQLHLSSSETTFDLLNDKISFLGSKSGLGSFLDHEGASFGDDEDFGRTSDELPSEMVSTEQRTGHSETERNIRKLAISETMFANEPALCDVRDRHAAFHGRNGMPTSSEGKKNSCTLQTAKRVPDVSPSEAECVSTPSPSHPPPRPVPALRIVKRTKALEQAKAAERNRSDLRTSRGKTSNISASRGPKRTSPEDAPFITTGNGLTIWDQANAKSKSTKTTRDDQSAGGPRRVLVTMLEDTKAQSNTMQAKSAICINGPRRVPASDAVNKVSSTGAKADFPVNNMGRPPVKYARVGPAVSGIPKPVSARNPGLRIPVSPSSKQRIGVQIETGKGFLGRRLGGK